MQLTLGEVATILDVPCGDPERKALGYSIDSRTLKEGELFFAIRGKRFDGHDFVSQAFERGAAGAVVEKAFVEGLEPRWAVSVLAVEDATVALQRLARTVRRQWGRPLVAITGSNGKTTTKEMIAAILARRFQVLKSPGNLNNDYGLPLALLALEPTHEVAVVELAMSAAGEIARLTRIAQPQIGLVMNVAPVHLQFFDSVDAIARAKRELIENLEPGSTAVLNYDDERVRRFREGFEGHVVTFGFEPGADFVALEVQGTSDQGMRFHVLGPRMKCDIRLPLPGRHNVQNALAAIATVQAFGVNREDLREALSSFQPLHQRCEILTLSEGITIVNDSYNSNPFAMEKMLETLAAWPGARRRVVLAGEMRELGPTSPEWHRKIGRLCVQSGVEWLLAVGGDAQFFVEGAVEAGLSSRQVRFFPTAEEAGEFCRSILQPGDVVLVKGSRALGLERAIELLHASAESRTKLAPGDPV